MLVKGMLFIVLGIFITITTVAVLLACVDVQYNQLAKCYAKQVNFTLD